jgi:hypothetical protein
VPDGFLPFSCAIDRLAEGMWGGLRRPAPVVTAKLAAGTGSIGFGPWQERAGQRLTAAVRDAELVVYVVADLLVASNTRPQSRMLIEPMIVPTNVLKRLTTSRGALRDHPLRLSMQTTNRDDRLLDLLTRGILVVSAQAFEAWYLTERAKAKWPSQRSSSRARNGRPTKQTDALRGHVIALSARGQWNAKAGIAKLHSLLVASGELAVPSADTIARLVDQLHRETGDPEFRRLRRTRRNQN